MGYFFKGYTQKVHGKKRKTNKFNTKQHALNHMIKGERIKQKMHMGGEATGSSLLDGGVPSKLFFP